MLVLGLMSGTSVDGIDAALVELNGAPPALRWRLVQHIATPYPSRVRDEIFDCFDPHRGSAERLCALNFAIGRAFAEAALACVRAAGLRMQDVQLIGSHGQTLWHIPAGENASTLQLGEPAVIAEMTGCPVVSHFRARDMAAGGQGAPLVACVDALLLTHPRLVRTALNIGGIAKFTYLPPADRGSTEAPFAFDTGPGNMLIDDAAVRLTGGAQTFDQDGRIASRGRINPTLLDEWMAHPYLCLAPPKTTGREVFGAPFADQVWRRAEALGVRGEDVIATLTAFTAASIARAHRDFLPRQPDEVIVSGGGARNPVLMDHLRQMLAPARVRITDEVGLPGAAKEALAFAVLAYETYHGRPGNLPAATGARHAVVLGSLTPGPSPAMPPARPVPPDSSHDEQTPATEAVNPASADIDTLDTLSMVTLINQEDHRAAEAVATQCHVIAQAINAIAQRLRAGGRLIYIGAGTSGRLGVLDASELPPTYNAPPHQVIGVIAGGAAALTQSAEGAEDDEALGRADIAALQVTARDCVMGIAASGATPYTLAAVREARARGALTLALVCNPDTPLHQAAEIVIAPVVGPEVISGSTRLKAGTATKLTLNTISTGVMIRLGKTFGNLMVDVRAKNIKLQKRARRIVAQACHVSLDEADAILAACDGEVKTAIVARLAGVTADEARARLRAAGGVVRQALGSSAQ